MYEILRQFQLKGTPIFCQRFGEGHINETYITTCDTGLSYILQKINTNTFKDPVGLMENVSAVTSFLAKTSEDPRGAMRIIDTKDGKPFYVDALNQYWRVYDFVPSSICLQKAESTQEFYNTGLAFGRFQKLLADFPAETLHESIPKFHDTRDRFRQLHEAVEKNRSGRLDTCQPELEFALAREKEAGVIVEALESGAMPWRVTHNDTKLNNILLDYDTHEPLCVIDLDTVMPGLVAFDFGDAIRSGANTGAEDERDIKKVSVDMVKYEAFTKGFVGSVRETLTQKEKESMALGALTMTVECGMRFLTDYLDGDKYFKIHYPDQNFVRARCHLALADDMIGRMDDMEEIVAKYCRD